MTQTSAEPVPMPPIPTPSEGEWVKVAEHTIDHLNGRAESGDQTRLQEMEEHYKGLGAQAVTISMNGHNSIEARAWNKQNNAEKGPAGDYVFSVMAHMPRRTPPQA